MSPKTHALLIADSRAHNFDNYRRPCALPYECHYIIERGGTTESLNTLVVEYLQSGQIPNDVNLIVKIAAGINNTTSWVPHQNTYVLAHKQDNNTLNGLIRLRKTILDMFPNAVISFITIPPVDFNKYREHRELDTNTEGSTEQISHLDCILELNKMLIELNRSQTQLKHAPHTSCWHSDVIRCSKKRKRDSRYRRKIKIRSERLYDEIGRAHV